MGGAWYTLSPGTLWERHGASELWDLVGGHGASELWDPVGKHGTP